MLILRKLKHEIRRKTPRITLHLLIQALDLNTLQFGQFEIQHDLPASQDQNPGLDWFQQLQLASSHRNLPSA